MTTHPALAADRVAVVTGAASGIGLAASTKFAALGMKVCMADANGEALEAAAARLRETAQRPDAVRTFAVDVSNLDSVQRLKASVFEAFGEVALLMNNAGTGGGGGLFGDPVRWRRILDVNLLGVVNGVQTFAPDMIRQETPAAIVNTGSKQGITCPPGDTAYNVSKAGVKVVTEALAHELRNVDGCRVSAHLLIPGFTFTGMTAGSHAAKPHGAWTARAGGRFHARLDGRRRLLHSLPRQRRAAALGRAPDPLGGGRHCREPAAALPLASGLQGRIRQIR